MPIMTHYLAIATSLLQKWQSTVRLHTDPSFKVQSSVTRPMQHQCYPSIAIGDKDSHEIYS